MKRGFGDGERLRKSPMRRESAEGEGGSRMSQREKKLIRDGGRRVSLRQEEDEVSRRGSLRARRSPKHMRRQQE
jgi:hypothetical protein